jgi:hypothetical protein
MYHGTPTRSLTHVISENATSAGELFATSTHAQAQAVEEELYTDHLMLTQLITDNRINHNLQCGGKVVVQVGECRA